MSLFLFLSAAQKIIPLRGLWSFLGQSKITLALRALAGLTGAWGMVGRKDTKHLIIYLSIIRLG